MAAKDRNRKLMTGLAVFVALAAVALFLLLPQGSLAADLVYGDF